jgi:DNA-binding winged helix-turn-helix (wHTH) protein
MRVAFGEYTFDSETRELARGGQSVHLSPKAFQLLAFVIERRPRAVSKEELYAHLWPATYVEEANLKNLTAEVRSALKDDPRAPRFIKTLYGYGYAFIAGATEHDAATPPATGAFFLRHFSRHFPLAGGENLIGRDPGCAVAIDAPDVSRYHARIVVSESSATIEDLGSKNGTFVEGVRIGGKTPLPAGAAIRLGETTLSFHHRDALASTKTAL